MAGARSPSISRSPEQVWRGIARAHLKEAGVTSGTGFGRSEGLRVGGKIFAMLVYGDQHPARWRVREEPRGETDGQRAPHLVVKLPRPRVDELAAAGLGDRFDPGHGRIMKEWIAVDPSASGQWASLVREARGFVAGTVDSRRGSAARPRRDG
jgi:hypothetical protein